MRKYRFKIPELGYIYFELDDNPDIILDRKNSIKMPLVYGIDLDKGGGPIFLFAKQLGKILWKDRASMSRFAWPEDWHEEYVRFIKDSVEIK